MALVRNPLDKICCHLRLHCFCTLRCVCWRGSHRVPYDCAVAEQLSGSRTSVGRLGGDTQKCRSAPCEPQLAGARGGCAPGLLPCRGKEGCIEDGLKPRNPDRKPHNDRGDRCEARPPVAWTSQGNRRCSARVAARESYGGLRSGSPACESPGALCQKLAQPTTTTALASHPHARCNWQDRKVERSRTPGPRRRERDEAP